MIQKELYKLGMENFKKVENLCGVIDKHIHDACPAIARLGIKPAMFNYIGTKVSYDTVTIRLFQLFKIINAEKPNVIFTYASKQYPLRTEGADYLYFDGGELGYLVVIS